YDENGAIARRGRVNYPALELLLAGPFFDAPPPKSTGRERFGADYAAMLYSVAPGADSVATAVELTARTVADAVTRFLPPTDEVLASGGGCHHPVLWKRLGELLHEMSRGATVLRSFD